MFHFLAAKKISDALNKNKACGGKIDSKNESELQDEKMYFFRIKLYHESFKEVVENIIGEQKWTE